MRQLSLPKSFYYVSQNRPIELSETVHHRLQWLGVWQRLRADGYTARNARAFLETLQQRSPYPVRAIQVDCGSEFQAEFEQACAEKGIQLFVLPPRSPKLNGHVERAQRTHTDEFHDRYMGELDLKPLNEAMREWEHVYNHIRPHYSLDLQTPAEYLARHHERLAPAA